MTILKLKIMEEIQFQPLPQHRDFSKSYLFCLADCAISFSIILMFMIWTRINFKILNATKQPLETVSSSSYEENIAIKLQESFPKYLSCSAVVTLEEMCLRTKLSEDPMHKGENKKKDNVNNGTIAELLFQQFFLSFSRLFYTLCICSLAEFYFGCSNTFKSLAFGVYKANSY